ncbi:roadblock/LC7 domain-containing protein [Streptomyces sp. NPDC099088]|uniref:roadblock/LC7 domain-containing protein n=1 Tax=Streptomyces sp. NPDC099088 TaxID=3366101 RepID=UPI00382EA421
MSVAAQNLNWLTSEFVRQVPAVSHSLVVSSDGLLLAHSQGLQRRSAEQLATISSGLASLARAGAEVLDAGAVVQTMVEMPMGYLFLMAVSDGSSLVALAARDCDLAQIGFEMTTLVERCAEWLTPAVRSESQGVLSK